MKLKDRTDTKHQINIIRTKQNGCILQTTFSNTFPWEIILCFDLNFTKVCSWGFQLTVREHCFDNGFNTELVTSHYLNLWYSYYLMSQYQVIDLCHHWFRQHLTFPVPNDYLIWYSLIIISSLKFKFIKIWIKILISFSKKIYQKQYIPQGVRWFCTNCWLPAMAEIVPMRGINCDMSQSCDSIDVGYVPCEMWLLNINIEVKDGHVTVVHLNQSKWKFNSLRPIQNEAFCRWHFQIYFLVWKYLYWNFTAIRSKWPLLLTWFNFNLSMDK